MRQITRDACEAFYDQKKFKRSNTRVQPCGDDSLMWLHDTIIAQYDHGADKLYIQHAGWTSVTTKERLNGVLNYYGHPHYIKQHDFMWYVVDENGVRFPFNKTDVITIDTTGYLQIN